MLDFQELQLVASVVIESAQESDISLDEALEKLLHHIDPRLDRLLDAVEIIEGFAAWHRGLPDHSKGCLVELVEQHAMRMGHSIHGYDPGLIQLGKQASELGLHPIELLATGAVAV